MRKKKIFLNLIIFLFFSISVLSCQNEGLELRPSNRAKTELEREQSLTQISHEDEERNEISKDVLDKIVRSNSFKRIYLNYKKQSEEVICIINKLDDEKKLDLKKVIHAFTKGNNKFLTLPQKKFESLGIFLKDIY